MLQCIASSYRIRLVCNELPGLSNDNAEVLSACTTARLPLSLTETLLTQPPTAAAKPNSAQRSVEGSQLCTAIHITVTVSIFQQCA